jgi:hypothetical protein
MDTSLEHTHAEEHSHLELAPHIRVARARAGVLMLIISDALGALAILAGGGYLSALNTEGQFKIPGDFAPSFVPELIIMIGLVLSGITYYLWERGARRAKDQPAFFVIALVLMLAAGIAETWIGAALKYGGPNITIDAYQSVQLLIVWFTGVHLLLAAVIGLLFGGRLLRGRPFKREYIAEVVGYWWYYTVIAAIALWVFAVLLGP